MGTAKNLAKRTLEVLPHPLRLLAFNAARGVARRILPAYRQSAATFQKLGSTVRSGPFRGMKYVSAAAGSTLLPKLLGTYELELWDFVESLVAAGPDLVIDIGSAEGYYAVGLARRLPGARLVCYDLDTFAVYLVRRMARKNGVADRLDARGLCTPEGLEELVSTAQRPLVVCDVDGAERELLRPDLTPSLAKATILLELHDHLVPGVSGVIRERFERTHRIQSILSRDRTAADLPADLGLDPAEAAFAMDEARGVVQEWYVLVPMPAGAGN